MYPKDRMPLVALCSILMLCLAGCRDEKDRRRTMCERLERTLSQHRVFPVRTKMLAQKALENWRNDMVDPVPVLLSASYGRTKNGELYLWLLMSDEDFDVSGIGIKERYHSPDTRVDTIEETYPLFANVPFMYSRKVRFDQRKQKEEKDVDAWQGYAANKEEGPSNSPPILISLPETGTVDVELWIYDHKGHESNRVPLTLWIYDRKGHEAR